MSWQSQREHQHFGECSDCFSTLAQLQISVSLVNHENGFIWRYFCRSRRVLAAHIEMCSGGRVYLPSVVRSSPRIGRVSYDGKG